MKKDIFTLQEVAKIFRVNPRTIFRLIHGQNETGNKLPALKVGRSWRITENDLKMFLLKNANVSSELELKRMMAVVKPEKSSKTKKK